MLALSLFSSVLVITSALSFPPDNLSSTCAATLCEVGHVCEETTTKGITQARCVPVDPRPSCANVRCDFGLVCVLQDVQCIQAPCYPQPTCVSAKPGRCRVPRPDEVGICASNCQSDAQCPEREKCCKNPCGATTCQKPLPTKPSCANVDCAPGQKCIIRPLRCFTHPCPAPRPECVPVDKPGTCPRLVNRPFHYFCQRRCRTDDQCPGAQKCCRTGCSTMCQDPTVPVPQFPTCATLKCRADHECVLRKTCNRLGCFPQPVCEPVKRCPFFPAVVSDCLPQHFCDLDNPNDCPSGTLCCSTNCGRRCIRPLA